MDKLKVQLSDNEDCKIVDGTIIKNENDVVQMEVNELHFRESDLKVGRKIRMEIFDDVDGLKVYECIVKYRLGKNVTLSNLSLLVDAQRRDDLKVKIDHQSIITCISIEPEVVIKARFLDISAGGICFEISSGKRRFKIGDTFETIFDMGRAPFFLKMEVLRVGSEDEEHFKYGCKFIDISTEEEQIIREFVFKTQLVARKKITRKLY